MCLPIGYALAWPDRSAAPFGAIDWTTLSRLDFEPPDLDAFPCLGLAYAAGRAGGVAPAWLNAANEEAVDAFLHGRIAWTDIAAVCATVLDGHEAGVPADVDDVIEADRHARRTARSVMGLTPTPPGPV
jgi:1-deoxy-D-xylulose-5-phosphate reductoisomerase